MSLRFRFGRWLPVIGRRGKPPRVEVTQQREADEQDEPIKQKVVKEIVNQTDVERQGISNLSKHRPMYRDRRS